MPSSGANTPLARLSLTGKLRVEVAGSAIGSLVIARKPAADCWVTVRLPVIAVAVGGTPLVPAIVSVRGTLLANVPASPTWPGPGRVSSTRTGASGLNVAPVSSARK